LTSTLAGAEAGVAGALAGSAATATDANTTAAIKVAIVFILFPFRLMKYAQSSNICSVARPCSLFITV
jgi:hypothetical protein